MLRDLLLQINWTDIVLAGLTGLFAVLCAWARRRRKELRRWLDARKERAEAIRSLPIRFTDVAKSVETLMSSNVRTTAQFTAIDEKLVEQSRILGGQSRVLAGLSAMAHGQMELDSVARFVFDNDGRNRFVNTAFARLLRVGRDELEAYGYRRFIPLTHNPDFFSGFVEAAKQHRTYEAEVLFERPDGSRFLARVRTIPHPEDVPPATHWNGMVIPLSEVTDDRRL